MSKAVQVEIHLRLLDCQVCGSEIPEGKEIYFKSLRLCGQCREVLKSNYIPGKYNRNQPF